MDIRTLKYFTVVAEELNITHAAKILNMSQPPLSTQMRLLEEELNTKLFIRDKKQLKLTEAGEYLYQKAIDIINLVNKAKDDISNIDSKMKGSITIGVVEGLAPFLASNFIAEYLEKHPNVDFTIHDNTTNNILEKLRTGLIHVAIITAPYDENILNSIEVGKENMVAFINNNNELAKAKQDILSIKDLAKENLITPSNKAMVSQIRKWFKQEGYDPKIVCMMDNFLNAYSLATNNVGVAIFPYTKLGINSKLVPFTIKEIDTKYKEVKYYFVWRKDFSLPKIEQELVDIVKSLYSK